MGPLDGIGSAAASNPPEPVTLGPDFQGWHDPPRTELHGRIVTVDKQAAFKLHAVYVAGVAADDGGTIHYIALPVDKEHLRSCIVSLVEQEGIEL